MNELQKNYPSATAKIVYDRLLAIVDLVGYYQIDYYTGYLTVQGVYLPNGLCVCSDYNQTTNEYEQFELEWNSFSEYFQRMILLEAGDRYCS